MVAIRPLPEPLQSKASKELNEVPDRIAADIVALRTWVEKSPHIRSRTDDQFLVTFLRGCKYSLEKAKEKLDMYHTVRTAIPELMSNRNPMDARQAEIIKMGIGLPLPIPLGGPDGPRILLIRPGVYDPSKVRIEEVMKISTMVNDILMHEDDNLIIAGQIGILDLKNVTMSHFLQFSPGFAKKMTMLSQEGSPLRQKGFHYVNTPSGFEIVFNKFKGFMSEKNQSRLYVHGNSMDSLYEHVPKKYLPLEYGGEAGPIENIRAEWEKKILDYNSFFQDESKYGTDEKKRPGRPKNADTLFGVDGSFRKLDFD